MIVILIGTDGPMRTSLAEGLRSEYRKIVEADTGAEGFEAALRHDPDAIVSETALPGFDGYDLLKIVRNSRLRDTPVILYSLGSAGGDDEDQRARVAGADALISSVTSPPVLVSAIEPHLLRVEAGRQRDHKPDFGSRTESSLFSDQQRERLMEEELRQSEKMEALGTLCGGIAHDFNNILTAIIGFANVLLLKLDKDNVTPLVENILAAAERAAALTSSLLSFSRKQPIELRATDLNTIVTDINSVLGRLLPESVRVVTTPAPVPLIINADPGQLGKALVNMGSNSRDAMVNGGEICIAVSPVDIDDEFVRNHGFGNPGHFALLSFRDNGSGMDEVTLQRIFEPFFSTKGRGKGTGLGLSIVYGVVKQHRGFIRCSSTPGHGTEFQIYLPLLGFPS